jgi:hypothetical protein
MVYYLVCILTINGENKDIDIFNCDDYEGALKIFTKKIEMRDHSFINHHNYTKDIIIKTAQSYKKYQTSLLKNNKHNIYIWIHEYEKEKRYNLDLSDRFLSSFPNNINNID